MRPHYTKPIRNIERKDVENLILLAIEEDAPDGDVTSESIFSRKEWAEAYLISKEEGIFCGFSIANLLLEIFNEKNQYHLKIIKSKQDGESFDKKEIVMKIQGELPGILRIERVLLNFIQYLSGISTLTYYTVKKIKEIHPSIYILDTRKTLPGYRKLSKYAVYCGGGTNHRIHLSDMAMIKDNHIVAEGSIHNAVKKIREKYKKIPIEIEVDYIEQIPEALQENPEVILLDNMDREQIFRAIGVIKKFCKENNIPVPMIEISGGWKPENFYQLQGLQNIGISMGYLTHSAKFIDIGMEIQKRKSQ